ncbi:class I SAM-dependent methyltransferase [Cytobacillus sp. FJAT-54145]|uniref:Class I SAM-dependent methyltransferase n=1 Tax=Cytobacillus spartinae TaxID=3299023 RepID=A0ABW6KDY7_9BACI
MNPNIYHHMNEQETSHWWHRARQEMILSFLSAQGVLSPSHSVLDVGCGTGFFLDTLKESGVNRYGMDFHTESLLLCQQKGIEVIEGCLPHVPSLVPVDTVLLLDVLEHVKEDRESLIHLQSVAKPDGHLLLTVPLHPWLWTSHDEALHHERRYRKDELLSLFQETGWTLEYGTCFQTHTFPLAVMSRLLKKMGVPLDEQKTPAPWLNERLYQLFKREESSLLQKKTHSYGLSYFAYLKKGA